MSDSSKRFLSTLPLSGYIEDKLTVTKRCLCRWQGRDVFAGCSSCVTFATSSRWCSSWTSYRRQRREGKKGVVWAGIRSNWRVWELDSGTWANRSYSAQWLRRPEQCL